MSEGFEMAQRDWAGEARPRGGPKLAAALVAAQRSARAVRKDSRNDHHRYDYASSESVIDEARGHLSAAGLALITTDWRHDAGSVYVDYELIHESGETRSLSTVTPAIEGKGRPLDKAVLAAITISLSYLLRGLLLMPRLDEVPIDQRDDTGHDPDALGESQAVELAAEMRMAATAAELDAIAARARGLRLQGRARSMLAEAFRECRDDLAEREAIQEEG